jgi:fermentation-respiration switch protein FrsA (DUF1100 family)
MIIAVSIILVIVITYFIMSVILFNKSTKGRQTEDNLFDEHQSRGVRPYLDELRSARSWLDKVPYDDIYVTSYDNLKLYAKFYHSKTPRAVAILVHGYQGDGETCYPIFAKFLLEQNIDVVIIRQRAHVHSEGKRLCFGIKERFDVQKWCEYVSSIIPKGMPMFLSGISMGGATVLLASSLDLPENVKFIVNDCGYSDTYEEFNAAAKFMHYIPILFTPIGRPFYKITEGIDIKKVRPVDEAAKSKLPILTIHGEEDTFVPFYMCKDIYNAIKSDKELITVPGATHGMSYLVDTKRCNEVFQRWIDKYLYN